MKSKRFNGKGRGGFSGIYLLVVMAVLCGLSSLAVDLGRVYVVKGQLQNAADAAARAGVSAVPTDLSAARTRAVQYALYHRADGKPIDVGAADVEFGRWDVATRTFQPLSGSALSGADAIRVTAARTKARGNATPLIFTALLGVKSCDATARAVARVTPPPADMSVVGLGFIRMTGSDRIDSYDSSLGPYSATNSGSDVYVASNGSISVSGSSVIDGNAYTGAGQTATGNITGDRLTLDQPLAYPAPTLPATYTSHGAITLGGGQSRTLSAGNHYVTSLSMSGNAELRVSGPVKLYIQGSLTIDGNAAIAVAGDKPANLEIYVMGAGPIHLGKNDLYAAIYAPLSPVYMNGNSDLFGSIIAASITMNGSNTIHYDTALNRPPAGPPRIVLVK